MPPKYDKTFCSQCGREFGPGDHGFSHCEDHDVTRAESAAKTFYERYVDAQDRYRVITGHDLAPREENGTMPKFLISYYSIHLGNIIYGYAIADDPIEWVDSVQKYKEMYILLNAQPMTAEQAKKYDGTFKGM